MRTAEVHPLLGLKHGGHFCLCYLQTAVIPSLIVHTLQAKPNRRLQKQRANRKGCDGLIKSASVNSNE
jgi:hypothetical protein